MNPIIITTKKQKTNTKEPVVVSYWWGGQCTNTSFDYLKNKPGKGKTYKELAISFEKNANKHGLDVYTEEIPTGDYQTLINNKPAFILRMMKKFPQRPILYLDIDMRIHKKPILFTKTNGFYDYMAFNWNTEHRVNTKVFDWITLETSGGIHYFNNNEHAKRLLRLWNEAIQKPVHKHKADDRVLAMVFKKNKAYQWLKFYWIPLEYFFVPQYFKNVVSTKSIVISHPYQMTNERENTNRVPANYNTIVKKTIKTFPYIVESSYSHSVVKKETQGRNKALRILVFTKRTKGLDSKYDISKWSKQRKQTH